MGVDYRTEYFLNSEYFSRPDVSLLIQEREENIYSAFALSYSIILVVCYKLFFHYLFFRPSR